MHISHVDWNDESFSIGQRKVAFVWWLMRARNVPMAQAKSMANSKFGPSEDAARRRRNRQDDAQRRREQAAIRRWGHPGGVA